MKMTTDELLKLKYERYRLGSQLSLSLALLFPETEGGLQGYITEHDITFSKRQPGRTRAGPRLRLNCMLRMPTPGASWNAFTSGCSCPHSWDWLWEARSKNSSGDFDQQ
ncbi:hypothetical protein PAL_GLEAN10017340 [Pteropus alecto]|uniref:Uncharacterized protein n=1 Tax=Pteropus alecto TaxID=9402 RepID=L5K3D1_PTEAL|nr:hypothetical protein PAL_GLEAN10017340 [Pteropus alecto]